MIEVDMLETDETELQDLKRQNEELVQALLDVKQDMRSRVLLSELKVEAVRAGMIDLDCLRLLNLKEISIDDNKLDKDVVQVIRDMKSRKPWLFQPASSSTGEAAPPLVIPAERRVMEMSDAEYKSARALLLRQLAH